MLFKHIHSHRSSRNDGSRNAERGTRNGIWDGFLHYGNENVPCSRSRNGVPGTWNAPTFHIPCDYFSYTDNTPNNLNLACCCFILVCNPGKLSCQQKDRNIHFFSRTRRRAAYLCIKRKRNIHMQKV